MVNKTAIPNDWKWVTLKEVCTIHQGYGFPKDLQGLKQGEYPFYKVGDISKNVKAGFRYLELCDNFIDENILLKLKAKPYPINTIVFAKIGEALKLNRRGILKKQGIVDNNAVGLKALEKICNDLFLFHFFTTVKLEDYSRATTVPSVRKSDIEDILFPLPSITIQQVIVCKIEELFSELDKGIENLHTTQQQLKTYRQSVLKWAFEGKLTNKQGEWENVKLGEVANAIDPQPSHRTPPAVQNGIPFVSIKDFDSDNDKIDFTKARRVSPDVLTAHLDRYQLETGDFVIGKIGTIGKPVRTVLPQNYTLSANIVLIQPRKIDATYLYYFFQSSLIEKAFTAGMKATTQAAFGIQKVRELRIELPCDEEQKEIVQVLESRLSVADKIEESITKSLQQAETLRQSILKKAFEGKLI